MGSRPSSVREATTLACQPFARLRRLVVAWQLSRTARWSQAASAATLASSYLAAPAATARSVHSLTTAPLISAKTISVPRSRLVSHHRTSLAKTRVVNLESASRRSPAAERRAAVQGRSVPMGASAVPRAVQPTHSATHRDAGRADREISPSRSVRIRNTTPHQVT